MKRRVLIFAMAVMTSALALAQTPRDPSSGSNLLGKSASSDAIFMKKLAVGDLAEADAGRLASQKSANEDVKHFGEQMVKDHSENATELKTLAASHGVEVPSTIDSLHAAEKSKLENAAGTAFDSEYIKGQVRDHEKTVALLQQEIRDGQEPAVKEFAQKTLQVVNHHLEMAKQLQATLPKSVAERSPQ